MKALVVTFFHVPWAAGDQTGIQRRFGAFLRALHRVCDDITMLHVVPAGMMESAGPLDALSRSQSSFWGVPLRIALAPRRTRAATAWNHYGAGVLDVAAQPAWFPYSGPDLAEAVGAAPRRGAGPRVRAPAAGDAADLAQRAAAGARAARH